MSHVVAVIVTITSTASRWQELFSWVLKLMVAFFQFENLMSPTQRVQMRDTVMLRNEYDSNHFKDKTSHIGS